MSFHRTTRWLGITIVCAYLCVLLLAPFYHAHPGEDHGHASGGSYHAHAEPVDSHPHDDEDDEQGPSSPIHLSQTNSPLRQQLVQTRLGWNVKLPSSKLSFEVQHLFTDHLTPTTHFGRLIAPQLREWYVQFATNLSPPRA